MMAIAKRVFLFLVINILVVTTISIILNLLNVGPYLNAHGLDYPSLMIFCLVWGMGGALISLSLSRVMAKWMMGVQVIDLHTTDPESQRLLKMVYKLAEDARLPVMPQVGIYNSPEMNAFATGPTKSRALVAVSSGILRKMSPKELEGVLAHEITHVANGDMVTMTLTQGIVNAFVMFLARILAFALSGMGKQEKNNSSSSIGASYYMLVFLFEIVFMVLGSLVIAWFSRAKEFRADRGGAELAGKDKMIAALSALNASHVVDLKKEQPAYAAFKISAPKKNRFLQLFSTHPPLEERIERLNQL